MNLTTTEIDKYNEPIIINGVDDFQRYGEIAEKLVAIKKAAESDIAERTAGAVARKKEADDEIKAVKAEYADGLAKIDRITREIAEKRLAWQRVANSQKVNGDTVDLLERLADRLIPGAGALIPRAPLTREPGPDIKQQATRKTAAVTVLDWSKVPAKYLELKQADVIRAAKAGINVPGVRVTYEDVPVRRY
jgi:hypothetical protein